jgi:hypothetical protein
MSDPFPRRARRRTALPARCLIAALALAPLARADQPAAAPSIPVAKLRELILTESPETTVKEGVQQRLVVRRIDLVDERGVIRMTLGAPTPPPIMDGIQYKRAFLTSGITLFDADGNERGGYGVADIPGSAPVLAQDHVNGDAIGWRVMPDGSVLFVMNERAPVRREPALGNRIVPGTGNATRIKLSVAADGTPAIALADKQDRPRLRLTVDDRGFGAIEFLDANGKVVDSVVPEARSRPQ